MTARETTLGALTAADLGKRVQVGDVSGVIEEINHAEGDTAVYLYGLPSGDPGGAPGTPVTVHDEEDA